MWIPVYLILLVYNGMYTRISITRHALIRHAAFFQCCIATDDDMIGLAVAERHISRICISCTASYVTFCIERYG